jgi:hypothetical protein
MRIKNKMEDNISLKKMKDVIYTEDIEAQMALFGDLLKLLKTNKAPQNTIDKVNEDFRIYTIIFQSLYESKGETNFNEIKQILPENYWVLFFDKYIRTSLKNLKKSVDEIDGEDLKRNLENKARNEYC